MEVASACFPSRGSDGWSPMTLWVAMREGDVYALCPLLPDKWSPPPMLIPSLSVSIVANLAATEDDPDVPKKSKLLSQQQMAWMADIDDQVPLHSEDSVGEGPGDVYLRPSKPGRVPRLQGPFEFELAPEESEDELDTLISDIFVIGAKIDAEGLMLGEENELEIDEDQEGLSMGVVCLLTSSGRLSICLDVDGVEAQWLPKNKAKFSGFVEDSDPPSLLTFQVLDTSRDGEVWKGNWPMFSHDVYSRYSFYITDTSSITFISLTPWVSRLEAELNQGGAGTDFRLDLLAKGQNSIRERVFTQKMDDHSTPLSASELIRDPDLGYMLVAATPYAPIAVSFELPEFEDDLVRRSRSPTYDLEPDKPLVLVEPRPVYQPAHILEEESGLPQFLERLRHSKYKRLLQEDVRLSPATLTIMTEIHQELSEETHRLGTAAAELFRKCDQLQIELRNQISKANDVAARVEQITGDDLTDGPALSSGQIIEERIRAVNNKQQEITARLEKIRKQATKGTRRELSDKEKLWIEEVNEMERKLIGSNNGENSQGRAKEVWTRYEQAQHLKDDLLEQIKGLSIEDEPLNSPNVKVPSEIRRAKLAQVMSLLDRETALVEGAKSRLERLGVA
jgi:nucleoporin NUP82